MAPLSNLLRAARSALALAGLALAVGCGGSDTPPPDTGPAVPAPVITAQPQSHATSAGQYVSLSVAATGSDLTFTWRKNGTILSGLTSAAYYTFKAALADSGAHYSVEVSNPGGSVVSEDAVLTVTPAVRDLIVNGSFEFLGGDGNATSWTFSDPQMTIKYADLSLSAPLGAGTFLLANGYWGAIHEDFVYQTVTIPADAVQAGLAFKQAVANVSFTPAAGAPVNTWKVRVLDEAGAELATLLTKTDGDANVVDGQPVWTSRSYDLLPYKGKTIRLEFASKQTDAAKNTLFGTDTVSLVVK